MSDLIPGSPYYREGYQLSARELQDTDDLTRAASRATFTGDGAGTAGYGGFSFTVAPEQEIMIIITGQETDEATYSWCAARRKVGYPNEWEFDPDGPASVYTEIPAHEVHNIKDVPILSVCRAWVSNQDGAMSLDFDGSGVAAYAKAGGGVKFHYTTDTVPSITGIELKYDPADGFFLTHEGGGVYRLDMLPATIGQNGVMSTVAQTFRGVKGFQDDVLVGQGGLGFLIALNDRVYFGSAANNCIVNIGPAPGPGSALYMSVGMSDMGGGFAGYAGLFDNVGTGEVFFRLRSNVPSRGGARYGCNDGGTDYLGQTGIVNSCRFVGGLWVAGPHPYSGGGGGGPVDGNYIDIIISGTGTVWTIANNAITSVKILNGAVTTSKIQDGAVTTPKIATGAVTPPKLSGGTRAMMAAYGG